MQTEMNKLFAEGGVMQEGGTVDPVSGNDVPPGAMQEEVRDDIDAKLSEGEFVIPADVVRYIGLEKLMMMRDKAKMGLQKMAEIGQMGNAEEVPDGEALHGGEDEMDDDAFSSEIDSIMGEDNGGEEDRGYADGGYVVPENREIYSDAPMKGFEMVPMTNDAGQTVFIPFINGVAQLNIPAGYKVKKAGVEEKPVEEKPVEAAAQTQPSGDGGGSGGDGGSVVGGNTDGTAPGGGQGISNDAISAGLAAMSFGQSGLGKAVSAILGLPLSTVANTVGTAVVDQQIDAIGKSVDAMSDAQSGSLSGQVATVSDQSGNISTVSNQSITDAFDQSVFGTTSQGLSDAAAANAAQAADNGPAAEGGNTAANAAASAASVGDTSSTSGEANADSSGDASGDSGVWAKGGFVSKPKKTKSKPKGLAGRR